MQSPPPAVFHDKYQGEIWKNTAGKSANYHHHYYYHCHYYYSTRAWSTCQAFFSLKIGFDCNPETIAFNDEKFFSTRNSWTEKEWNKETRISRKREERDEKKIRSDLPMGWDAFCTGEEKGLINMTYADIIQALWTAWQNDNSKDRNENYLSHIHPSGDHSSPLSRSCLTVDQHRRDHSVAHRVELRRDVSRKKHVAKENTLRAIF